jgi:hypothetical protein
MPAAISSAGLGRGDELDRKCADDVEGPHSAEGYERAGVDDEELRGRAKAASSSASSGRRLLIETPTRGKAARNSTRPMPQSSAALPEDKRPSSYSFAASISLASRSN